MNILRAGVAIASVFIASALFSADATETYTLGPGDHLEVKVSDFRSGTGEAYQWTGFTVGTEDFIVAPNGQVSLPVVGDLDAAGKTTAELEGAIAARLQVKAGLTTKPDASVQVVKFRPFYVVGEVDKPGEYDYRPGLTVLQAIGIAGGLERVTTDAMIGFMRDALTSRGDLRVYAADRTSLVARQARIDAEAAERDEIAFPDELRSKAGDPDVARAMREEQLLFDTRRTGLATEVETLERNKAYLRVEIDSLRQKNATIAKQIASMRKEFDIIAGLVSKGLTAAPRQLELEQNISQIESNQLDVQVAIVRATEDITRSDHDIIDLKTTRRKEMLQEAEDVRVKLAETIERIQTSQAVVEQDEVRAPMLMMTNAAGFAKPAYFIFRRANDGKAENVAASERDLIQPGDVVRVVPRPGVGEPMSERSAAVVGAAN